HGGAGGGEVGADTDQPLDALGARRIDDRVRLGRVVGQVAVAVDPPQALIALRAISTASVAGAHRFDAPAVPLASRPGGRQWTGDRVGHASRRGKRAGPFSSALPAVV